MATVKVVGAGHRYLFLALSLGFVTAGCSGVAFVVDEALCTGPHCDITCSTTSQCPAGTVCHLGRCSFAPGGDHFLWLVDSNPSGDTRGFTGGDRAGDSNGRFGDAGGAGDQKLVVGGGDFAAPGDRLVPNLGDTLVSGADGQVCDDPDQDGYCPCCVLGDDCVGGEDDDTIFPGAPELCDFLDNDCNSQVDEGVINLCGNCKGPPFCHEDDSDWSGPEGGSSGTDPGNLDPGGDPNDPFDPEGNGVDFIDPDGDGYGSITLATGAVATDFAYGANERDGTVSRVRTRGGDPMGGMGCPDDPTYCSEVSRYVSTLWRPGDPYRPLIAQWSGGHSCAEPSRSTIDQFGNAYVANRAVTGYSGRCGPDNTYQNTEPFDFGSVTKVGYLHPQLCDEAVNPTLSGCQCIDRNANGRIDTSVDFDMPPNGIQQVLCTGSRCDETWDGMAWQPGVVCTDNFGCPAGTECVGSPGSFSGGTWGGYCTDCVDDTDCGPGTYCVREVAPTQPTGRCSDQQPAIEPCAGGFCGNMCIDDTDCTAMALGATFDHFCVRGSCSSLPTTPIYEFRGRDDECVLWTRRIPGNETGATPTPVSTAPRAMAVDRQGFIWVGDNQRNGVFKLRADGEFVNPTQPSWPDSTDPEAITYPVCPRVPHFRNNTTWNSVMYSAQDIAPMEYEWNRDFNANTGFYTPRCSCDADPNAFDCNVDQTMGVIDFETTTDGAERCYDFNNSVFDNVREFVGRPEGCVTNTCYFTVSTACRIAANVSPYGAVIDSGKHRYPIGGPGVDTPPMTPNPYPVRNGTDTNWCNQADCTNWCTTPPCADPDGGSFNEPKFGFVWLTQGGGNIQRIDTLNGRLSQNFSNGQLALDPGAYGISIDHEDRVWLADRGTDARPELHRLNADDPAFDAYDNSNNGTMWSDVTASDVCVGADCGNGCAVDDDCLPPSLCNGSGVCAEPWQEHNNWRGRGVTTELLADSDCMPLLGETPPCSRVWGSFNNSWTGTPNYVVAFNADTGAELTTWRKRWDRRVDGVTGNICAGPVGVGIGFGGRIWAVNGADSMCAMDPANYDATVSMLATEQIEVPIGDNPYTYSDFTGNIFRSFTNPQGDYYVLVQACPGGMELERWGQMTYRADVPSASRLEIRFRFGADITEALTGPQINLIAHDGPIDMPTDFSTILPPAANKPFLQIEFKFIADDITNAAPTLYMVDVGRSCKLPG